MSDYRLHDDGERIIVYADRRRTLRQAQMLSFLTLLCLVGAGSVFILPQDPLEPTDWRVSVVSFGSIACLLAIQALLSFAGYWKRSPTLIVTAEGIVDRCSSIVGGKGLLPWKEIAWGRL